MPRPPQHVVTAGRRKHRRACSISPALFQVCLASSHPYCPACLPPPLPQREGLKGLYAGILPEYYKVVPGVAIAFCTYELMKKVLEVQTNATQR